MKSLWLVALAICTTPAGATSYDFGGPKSITFIGGTYFMSFGAQLIDGTSGWLSISYDAIGPKFDPRGRPPCFVDPTCNDTRELLLSGGGFQLSYTPSSFNAFPNTQPFDVYQFKTTTFTFRGDGNARIDVPDSLTLESPIPEPASWVMMVSGFGLAGGVMRKRKLVMNYTQRL